VPYSCSPSKEASHNARVDDYVLLKLLPKGRKAAHPTYYVGNVMGVIDSQYRVQCLRRHNMSLCAFFYPDKEDIALYSLSDIVVTLPQPKIVRSIYHFPAEVLRHMPMVFARFVVLYHSFILVDFSISVLGVLDLLFVFYTV
jgi:hypothetical protein